VFASALQAKEARYQSARDMQLAAQDAVRRHERPSSPQAAQRRPYAVAARGLAPTVLGKQPRQQSRVASSVRAAGVRPGASEAARKGMLVFAGGDDHNRSASGLTSSVRVSTATSGEPETEPRGSLHMDGKAPEAVHP